MPLRKQNYHKITILLYILYKHCKIEIIIINSKLHFRDNKRITNIIFMKFHVSFILIYHLWRKLTTDIGVGGYTYMLDGHYAVIVIDSRWYHFAFPTVHHKISYYITGIEAFYSMAIFYRSLNPFRYHSIAQ